MKFVSNLLLNEDLRENVYRNAIMWERKDILSNMQAQTLIDIA